MTISVAQQLRHQKTQAQQEKNDANPYKIDR